MTRNLIVLALLLACPDAFAATDCSKNSDACAAGVKKLSPFEEASLRESAPPHAETASGKTAPQAIPAAGPASAASSSPVAAVQPPLPPGPGGNLSSPAWLILVIAGFAGLYFYLRGGLKKRRRK